MGCHAGTYARRMAKKPDIHEVYFGYLQGRIEVLRTELVPYETRTARAGRRAGQVWIDITGARVDQIKREIEVFENAIAQHREHWGRLRA